MSTKRTKNYLAVSIIFILLSSFSFNKENVQGQVPSISAQTVSRENNERFALVSTICPEGFSADHEKSLITTALEEAAESHQLDVELLAAVMATESKCRLNARSRRGALGLMQLMPRTAKRLGVTNPYSAKDNVFGAAKYLSKLLQDFDGNIELALAAYNSGPETVKRFRSVPPYRETRSYVRKVLNHYQALQQMART